MRMPISKPGNARFKGPTSSHDFNQMEDDKYLDLVELYKAQNDNEKNLKEAYQTIVAEHVALQNYVEVLENKIRDLEVKFSVLDNENQYYNGRFFKTGFVDEMTTTYPSHDQDQDVKENRGDIDVYHRFTSLPIVSQIPKTHVLDRNNQVVIPESLKVEVTREGTEGVVSENDIMNAFNGDNYSYWRREVAYHPLQAPDKEVAIIEISIPTNLVNNLNINTINIHPHPERGIEITNVEMHYNNAWTQIDGFKQNQLAGYSHLSEKTKWYFSNKPVQRIRITLTQHNSIQVGEQRIFVLGAQEIGIHLSSFDSNGGFVLAPISMEDVGMYSIDEIEPIFINDGAFSVSPEFDDLEGVIYDYEILKEQNSVLEPLSESEWTNQTAKRLWVKTMLYPDPNNGVSPCLHAVRLHYSKV